MHLSEIESMQIPLRGATQPLDLRWGFETTSNLFTLRQRVKMTFFAVSTRYNRLSINGFLNSGKALNCAQRLLTFSGFIVKIAH